MSETVMWIHVVFHIILIQPKPKLQLLTSYMNKENEKVNAFLENPVKKIMQPGVK